MDVIDGVYLEVVLVQSRDDGDLLPVRFFVELVDGGHVDSTLICCAVGLDRHELHDDRVAQLKVLLLQQFIHEGLDLGFYNLMLAHDGHR